ncbi:carbohydrate ABC transporter membrane protein 2, CUT1 family [Sanguibacter gelidistatuariae]|uniref:Carbohydrate ABC transporter membrane protein 2, CUT1 family n=1 Tax=Sanguibacter gelidistatuariae TaxID=1814289 RepID=A0A1G6HLL3_9MICO|nr:carbohydrate ABC transporter permease [Sanguibacter gelidistatuariae]SDB94775.1 carbohydrate ABC transporter membrane protein 2, CUT1 family [Sanguibacter gelidistatuariae]
MNARIRSTLTTAITWALVLAFFFPVAWMILNAFKTEGVAASSPPVIFFDATLENFRRLGERGISGYMINSAVASIGSTLFVIVLAFPAAYALSIRPVGKVQDTLFYFISTRFLPIAAGILPLYIIFKNIGVLDTVGALFIVYTAMNLPIAVWMIRSFLNEVPFEVIEASRLDGANFFKEMTNIVLPMVLPGVAAAALICFIFAWNEYFVATLLTSSAARTVPPFLASFVDGRGQFLASLSAAATVAVLPVILAGWIAQKQLVRGLSMGAIK